MAGSTAQYGTGFRAVVTINTTTYSNAKYFNLPDPSADVVKVKHLGGLAVLPDGRSDFGKIVVSIPQDGSALLVDSNSGTGAPNYYSVAVACQTGSLSGRTFTATSAYCTKDGGGNLKRGDTVDRMLEFEETQEGVWS